MAHQTARRLGPGRKRKREDEVFHARKTSRVVPTVPSVNVDFRDQALQLEEEILDSHTNYNSIPTLLEYSQSEDGAKNERVIAAVALCRVFCRLMARGSLSKLGESLGNEFTIMQWLRERLRDYEQALLRILRAENIGTQSTALTLLMRLVKEKALYLNQSEDTMWQQGLFGQLVQTLVEKEVAEETRSEFAEKYVKEYEDIRFYTFLCLAGLASMKRSDPFVHNTLMILAVVEPIPEQQERTKKFYVGPPNKAKHDLYSLDAHRRQAQRAWIALLRQNLSKSQRKMILELMSHQIAPWFMKVELLMDFLTDSFNVGGSMSLLALSGLFYLIQHKNLDFPQFYQKLYFLLDSEILHSKHRSRFFRLLDTFLASTHMPAALVASFVKRLARLSLFAPPSGIVVIVPWVYNLLKSHPSCTFMVHRNSEVCQNQGTWGDPFREEEPNPMETDALGSSLWEIQMLQSHYHPNVATIAKIISEQFTKQAYNPEDFLDHSYGTILDAELLTNLKKPPEIGYEIPKKIFMKHDIDSAKEDSLLARIWSFG